MHNTDVINYLTLLLSERILRIMHVKRAYLCSNLYCIYLTAGKVKKTQSHVAREGLSLEHSLLWFAYSSFLIHICSVGQEVHHTLIVAFSGSPDQWSGAILGKKQDKHDL